MRIIYSHPDYGTEEFATETERVVVGRPKPGVVVDLDLTPDGQVSRRHARLTYEDGAYWIKDLGSKRGTWVDGQKITEKTRLTPWGGALTTSCARLMMRKRCLMRRKMRRKTPGCVWRWK